MTKKKNTLSKDSSKKTKDPIREIHMVDFYFQKKNDKQKIVVKDILITINSERTPEQIEGVISDPYYKIKALRSYFKSESRVFNQQDALEKYTPVKIDFIKKIGVSFA